MGGLTRPIKLLGGFGAALIGIFAISLAFAMPAMALASVGPVGTAARFEDNDANLAADNTGFFDWNSLAPVVWKGSAPYQSASTKVSNGSQSWTFEGLTDAMGDTTDTGFAGGTKQDQNCPAVIGTKSPNKDDLQSAYFATSVGSNGHIYLMLAWERIPQNTTSPSAHVAFEFNQGSTSCSGSNLVSRTAGDMLIVYDFTGGSTSTPTLGLSRWITSGTCQVNSDSAPCWGVQTTLPAGVAEGAVDTGLSPYPGTASDSVAQGSYLSPNGALSLGTSQFGEAGVDLTAAGVFSANTCTTFGTGWAVSRSSGNSATAAMEDLVGPGAFNVSNCGNIHVVKKTVPSGSSQSFGYTTSGGLSPATFSLTDGQKQDFGPLHPGTYTVTEASTTGWALTGLDCTAGGSADLNGATATYAVTPDSDISCTFTNTEQLGAIEVTKTSSKAAATPLAGATFLITGSNNYSQSVTTGTGGTACVDNLPFGTYSVTETAAPSGYAIDTASAVSAVVNQDATCSTGPAFQLTFTDTPLTDVSASATSEAPGGTQSTITCVDSNSANIGNSPQSGGTVNVSATALKPGTYTCTIVVDP